MKAFVLKTTPAREEDLIALLAAPGGILQAYRFYGMRHSAILPGNFIDFELESAGVFLPKMRRIMQLAMPFDVPPNIALEQLLHGGFCAETAATGGAEIGEKDRGARGENAKNVTPTGGAETGDDFAPAAQRATLGQKASSLGEIAELLYRPKSERSAAIKLASAPILAPIYAPQGAAPTALAKRPQMPSTPPLARCKNIPAHMEFSRFVQILAARVHECESPVYFAQLLQFAYELRLAHPKRAFVNAAARILRAEGRLHPQDACARCGVALGKYCALGADFLPHCRQCLGANCFETAAVREFLATCNCAIFAEAYLLELANCWHARR